MKDQKEASEQSSRKNAINDKNLQIFSQQKKLDKPPQVP